MTDSIPDGFVVIDENRVRKIERKTEPESSAIHYRFTLSIPVWECRNGLWAFYDKDGKAMGLPEIT